MPAHQFYIKFLPARDPATFARVLFPRRYGSKVMGNTARTTVLLSIRTIQAERLDEVQADPIRRYFLDRNRTRDCAPRKFNVEGESIRPAERRRRRVARDVSDKSTVTSSSAVPAAVPRCTTIVRHRAERILTITRAGAYATGEIPARPSYALSRFQHVSKQRDYLSANRRRSRRRPAIVGG